MRHFLAVLAGLLAAVTSLVGLIFLGFVIGGTECDRGECNRVGEAIDENGTVFFVAYVFMAVAVGTLLGRALARR